MKDTFSVIHARKSVRNFTDASVSKTDLDKIIRAGMAAPTAVNMQPWSFIVVTGRKKNMWSGLLTAQKTIHWTLLHFLMITHFNVQD